MDWLATSADSLVGQAPAVAAELLAQAVGSIPAGSARHGWLAGRLADALYRTADREAAVRVAERALGHASDPDLVVDLHWTLAQCRMLAGSVEASFATIERALAAPGLSAKHRARLLVLGARTYLYFGDVDAAGREANRALDSAVGAGDSLGHGLGAARAALGGRDPGRPDRRAAALRERARRHRDRPGAGRPWTAAAGQQGCNALQPQPLRRGADHGGGARQLADQFGTPFRLGQAHGILGQLFFETGRWDDALAEIAIVPTDLKEPAAASDELAITAMISFHRNEPEAARRHLADAEPHTRAGRAAVHPPAAARHGRSTASSPARPRRRSPCSPPRSTITPTTSGRSRTC